MPNLNDIKDTKGKFKKREYRPWNLEGAPSSSTLGEGTSEILDNKFTEQNHIQEVSPHEIINWEFHDRPENELGDLEGLAKEFNEIGQQQPCIVRELPKKDNKHLYELIVGERRWRAAKIAGIDLKVLVKNLTDTEAAIIQASENNSRKDLSDYAKGISYAQLIEKNIITQKDLGEKLGISKQQMSRLLSFSKIPIEIISSIKDLSKISARTAEQIKQLSNKGEAYVTAIIALSDKLREGQIGQETLLTLVEKSINKIQNNSSNNKIYSKNGRHLFTWRKDNNNCPSIHFPKDIVQLISRKKIDLSNLTQRITSLIEDTLMNIDESPAGD